MLEPRRRPSYWTSERSRVNFVSLSDLGTRPAESAQTNLSDGGVDGNPQIPPTPKKPRRTRERVVRSEVPGLVALDRLPRTSSATSPHAVRSSDVFQHPVVGLRAPLNRKTTANAVQSLPLTRLEPTTETIPVQGLEKYFVQPRRDPPDIAHAVMRNGRERWLIQEGHTRLGAAKLRGDECADCRVWEFTEGERGSLQPVPRGRHRRGKPTAISWSRWRGPRGGNRRGPCIWTGTRTPPIHRQEEAGMPQPKPKGPDFAIQDEDGTYRDRELWAEILGDDMPDEEDEEPESEEDEME
jgi:hypothetical protein